jgi:signal transduction histidine kinase
VYAERSDDALEVFVRDNGVGFDVDRIDDDRRGVRSSILERMAREGGSATVHSEPGVGTEVELRLPYHPTATETPQPASPETPQPGWTEAAGTGESR